MGNEQTNGIVIYQTAGGSVKVRLESDTVWLSQASLAELYGTSKQNVSQHIKTILESGELNENSVVKNFFTTAEDGKRYQGKYYNLDMIIALGYRINSKTATQFRVWATEVLREYIDKGFALDDERLKNLGGGNYWTELKARIRDIRASEKVFYRQVLEIYATSIDYDAKSKTSQDFFKMAQNKIHYAVHGDTAAEVIYNRVDSEKDFMGVVSFTGNHPTLQESKIAKNYLNEQELKAMGQIVEGYLAFAERQADRHIQMKMTDWAEHLDTILTMSGEELLQNAGKITHDLAMDKVETEYKKYKARTLSDVEIDFLETVQKITKELEGRK